MSYCTFAIPTTQLWFACFIANAVLVYLVIPFAMFYYEADSDACAPGHLALPCQTPLAPARPCATALGALCTHVAAWLT